MDRNTLPDIGPGPDVQDRQARSAFGTLRQYVKTDEAQEQEEAVERCELCSEPLGRHNHRHLLRMDDRQILCSCSPCALRFENVVGGRYKLIPRDTRTLPSFRMTDVQWSRLSIPIELAFFFRNDQQRNSQKEDAAEGTTVTALYPSPAGATESLLPLQAWGDLAEANPILKEMKPDVEALLVNRRGETNAYYRAPIDTCYELVGRIRLRWQGLAGGTAVWEDIARFFDRLDDKARPL